MNGKYSNYSNKNGETSATSMIPGWNNSLESAFSVYNGPYIPGRITTQHKTVFNILTEKGQIQAAISGAMHRVGKHPVVGDFVVLLDQSDIGSHTIVDILPRTSCLSRGSAGDSGEEQLIAANINTIFIVTAVGHDLNVRRLERYLTIVHSSGAKPVIVINKIDLAEDLPDDELETIQEIRDIADDVPVITLSALTSTDLEKLGPFMNPGETIALVGSSGVGKSTLINALLGHDVQKTLSVREDDDKGRHTTTVRQLFTLQNGTTRYSSTTPAFVRFSSEIHPMASTGHFPILPNLPKVAVSRIVHTGTSLTVPSEKQLKMESYLRKGLTAIINSVMSWLSRQIRLRLV